MSTAPMIAEVGFIGLGAMGSALARRLLESGRTVHGYNRTAARAEALASAGLRVCGSIAQVLAAADVVFVSVTDNAASREVFFGRDGILDNVRSGATVVVDTSTISPEQSQQTAEAVRAKGGDMVDCPVSGNPVNVGAGKASTMVGGRRDTYERILPVLLALGPASTHVGDNGKGLSMKVAVNLNLAIQIQGFAEAVLVAEKAGISREAAVAVLTKSAVASPNIQSRGPRILAMPDETQDRFPTVMMQKDLQLALDMGKRLCSPLPMTALAHDMLTATRAHGWEHEDFCAVFFTLCVLGGGTRAPLPRAAASSCAAVGDVAEGGAPK